ncbi:MAG: hypothetical protein OWT28_07670 [Firmicutes bacterium]|nr:hypothetical protein [Bacillota bacterium]
MVLDAVIVCFALYGVIMIMWQLWKRRGRRVNLSAPVIFVVVEDANQWMEWFLRKVSLELYALGHMVSDIMIIDVSASGETAQIVSRLSRSYSYVTYVPSSQERRWIDVVSLLEAAPRAQALLVEISDEDEIETTIRVISKLAT